MKNTYVKAVAGSTLAAALLVAPTLATSSGPALAAPYNTSIATSTSVDPDGPFAEYGSQPTVTATVTPTGWTVAPTGEVRFFVTFVRSGTTRTLANDVLPLSSTGTATYTFPVDADANQTYRVSASYLGDTHYNGSTTDRAASVTIYPRTTTTTLGTVSGPEYDGDGLATFYVPVRVEAEYGTPTGHVALFCDHLDADGDPTWVEDDAEVENGEALLQCAVPVGQTVTITATFYGDVNSYDDSNTNDTPVVVTS